VIQRIGGIILGRTNIGRVVKVERMRLRELLEFYDSSMRQWSSTRRKLRYFISIQAGKFPHNLSTLIHIPFATVINCLV